MSGRSMSFESQFHAAVSLLGTILAFTYLGKEGVVNSLPGGVRYIR